MKRETPNKTTNDQKQIEFVKNRYVTLNTEP